MTNKIMPMLAKPLPVGFNPSPGRYVAEEKFDGHRLIVRVGDSIQSWSRLGNDSNRKLSTEMLKALRLLPPGVYDGELVQHKGKSYDVARLTNISTLTYMIFDVLELNDDAVMHMKYGGRRALLEGIFNNPPFREVDWRDAKMALAPMWAIANAAHLSDLSEQIWLQGGEGLIVKDRQAPYRAGKRDAAFLKIKQCLPAVLTVTGFEASKGEIVNRGPCAMTLLRDDDGNETSVKTLDDATCRQIELHPAAFIGRRLCIEYHERTPDGSYRHGRWDRWEDE